MLKGREIQSELTWLAAGHVTDHVVLGRSLSGRASMVPD